MTAAVLEHTYAPRGTAAQVITDKTPELLVAGPAGTGKSRACLEKLHIVCMLRPNVRALIVRQTFMSLRNSALRTYQDHVAAEHIRAGQVNVYGGTIVQQFQYRNGSTIDVGGLDKPGKILSTEYDIIYIQEADQLTLEGWEVLTTRLRGTALSYRQLLADCNPAHDTHWLYLRALEGKTKMLESRHEENPILFNNDGTLTELGVDYIMRLDNLSGIWLQRYRYGKWVGAEGVIYDNFDPRKHIVDEMPKGWESWPTYWSVDFGFNHPMVVQMWAEDPDGKLYLFKEFFRTQKLVEDFCKDIKAEGWHKSPYVILADHDAEDRATFERHIGMSTRPAKKTVSDGIQAVHIRFKADRIALLRSALVRRDQKLVDKREPTCTIEEIAGYVWKPGKDQEPVKEFDDGCDAMRYVVAHKDLVSQSRVRSVRW